LHANVEARVAQSVERTALNRMVVGSTPTSGAFLNHFMIANIRTLVISGFLLSSVFVTSVLLSIFTNKPVAVADSFTLAPLETTAFEVEMTPLTEEVPLNPTNITEAPLLVIDDTTEPEIISESVTSLPLIEQEVTESPESETPHPIPTQSFCGAASFPWPKGPFGLWRGRLHRVICVTIEENLLDIVNYYSRLRRGYDRDIIRQVNFTIDETGQLGFPSTSPTLPILRQTEDKTGLIAEFESLRQSVPLTKEACESTPYTDELATVRRYF